ncbi:hypothetical protein EUGRSUZ_H04909 [Eucalyptus grandis]|uniref:Uncharacterized protein n=2 Tax=Eucalyptus grandis TaxID=71139 RepID=A0ACC3JYP4_EUCGR|nr:hypothetical protein EUGRSUZ_H04909 [Eucalyptus grandis]
MRLQTRTFKCLVPRDFFFFCFHKLADAVLLRLDGLSLVHGRTTPSSSGVPNFYINYFRRCPFFFFFCLFLF